MERWWTTPVEGTGGKTVIVTGRDYLEKQMGSGKYPYMIRVYWNYNADADGMPEEGDAELMGKVTDALTAEFKRDKAAYLVGIYTGEGRRDWIFYTGNLNIFNKVFNRALAEIETIPIVIEADSDPEWTEYKEMRELSYVPENDEER